MDIKTETTHTRVTKVYLTARDLKDVVADAVLAKAKLCGGAGVTVEIDFRLGSGDLGARDMQRVFAHVTVTEDLRPQPEEAADVVR